MTSFCSIYWMRKFVTNFKVIDDAYTWLHFKFVVDLVDFSKIIWCSLTTTLKIIFHSQTTLFNWIKSLRLFSFIASTTLQTQAQIAFLLPKTNNKLTNEQSFQQRKRKFCFRQNYFYYNFSNDSFADAD